jgi:hypothetical protein
MCTDQPTDGYGCSILLLATRDVRSSHLVVNKRSPIFDTSFELRSSRGCDGCSSRTTGPNTKIKWSEIQNSDAEIKARISSIVICTTLLGFFAGRGKKGRKVLE